MNKLLYYKGELPLTVKETLCNRYIAGAKIDPNGSAGGNDMKIEPTIRVIQCMQRQNYDWVKYAGRNTVELIAFYFKRCHDSDKPQAAFMLLQLYRGKTELQGDIRRREWKQSHSDQSCTFGHTDKPAHNYLPDITG